MLVKRLVETGAILLLTIGITALVLATAITLLFGPPALLTHPLIVLVPPIFQAILALAPWVIVGSSLYTVYRSFIKGPAITMTSPEGGVGWITYEHPAPEAMASADKVASPRQASRFEVYADVFFPNAGNRAGAVIEFGAKFVPSTELKEFLRRSGSEHWAFMGEDVGARTIHTDFVVEGAGVVGLRVCATCELNIDTGTREEIRARRKDWRSFLSRDGTPPELGFFWIFAKHLDRSGNAAAFPQMEVHVRASVKLTQELYKKESEGGRFDDLFEKEDSRKIEELRKALGFDPEGDPSQ